MTVQDYNDLYKRPMVKYTKIESSGGVTITNTNIVSEQMSLEKSLCSESNLRFGRCEAACFKVRIADIDHDFTGEWLTVTQDAKADIEGYLLTQDGKYLYTEDGQRIQVEYKRDIEDLAQLGHFKVYSDKPDNDRRWKNLTCYDRMYDILNADVAAWYNGLTFPMTIKVLRDSFFNYIGVTQKTTTLVNDNFVTQGGFSVTGSLSGKTVIEAICELNGVFGVMAPDDKFDYVSLANPETLTLDYYVDGTGSYEDYVTDVITGICAKGSESDIGTSVGTTENVYTIVNNPLINGTEGTAALTTALNNLLQNILSISFRPFQVTTYGNPMLPLGTRITINTRNQTIISYVINKEMTGVQGLRDKISAKSDKHQSENINSSYDEIYRTKGKVHELKIDVDGLVSRMATTESKLDNDYYTKSQTESKISQTESEIMTTVSNSYVTQASYNSEIQNLQDQIDGRIEYFDGNVVPTLNNSPASSWTTTAAKDSHVGDLYRYHYTQSGVERTDYYRFDKDTSTSPATFSWVALGESEVDEALRQAELANQKADAAQQQLDALQSDVEDNYYTKSATDSKIQQTANSITQSVSSTYETKSDSTSKFNTADANAQGYANTALATANTNAQSYANSARDAANAATDNKLTSYYTKTQTDSQIAQTANSITSSVSSTYETKSDATAKLNTANNNAQTYANNARDSANASTDNKLQNYYTKSETNSQIQQTASSITSTVAQTYTTKTEFNNLQIGGNNLIRNTWDYKQIYISNPQTTSVKYDESAPYVRMAETSVTWDHFFTKPHMAIDRIQGKTITISLEVRLNEDIGPTANAFYVSLIGFISENANARNSNKDWSGNTNLLTKGKWVKISYTVDVDKSNWNKNSGTTVEDIKYFNIGVYNHINKSIDFRFLKVEIGTKATDWSPAPEDAEDYADSVGVSTLSAANAATDQKLTNYSTKSEVTQLANKIVMKVDGNGNIVQVALSADPSTGTVFTVGADNIELTAAETINLMAGGTINLSAGHINISGSSSSGSVSIDENGLLTCSGANVTGTIHANTGDIGGWSISSDKLYGGASDYFCAMLKPTSTAKYSFVSGATTSAYDDAAFRVTPQGYLYAKNLVLTAYPGNQPSSVLYGKNGIWLYGTTSGSAIWFSDPSTPDLHSTILMMGNNGLIQCKSLNCSGTKKRVVETADYGTRSLYCYETPSPMFGDIGEGKIAEDGKCYVWLDSTFSETIKTESYQVFLQKYGQGECYVTERTSRYFVVEGDAGMCFGWEIKARQAGFENERLETYIEPEKPKDEYDYPMEAIKHLEIIKDERTVA